MVADAQRLATPHANARAVLLDMSNRQAVESLVEESDIVIRYVCEGLRNI